MNCYLMILMIVGATTLTAVATAGVIDVRSTGAVGDGKTMDTAAIQRAIDSVSSSGGGVVLLTQGTFLSGTIEMKSHVTLQIDKTATLLGSPHQTDYRKSRLLALLISRAQEDIGICGEGVIDGQGRLLAADVERLAVENNWQIDQSSLGKRPNEKYRPLLIEFDECQKVRVTGITLKNSCCLVQAYQNCSHVTIDRITVYSMAYGNNDGIDLIDCRHVRVSNCDINAGDDGICLKSQDPQGACEDVVIENCKIRSSASGLKFGTASKGGFKRIRVNNLFVYDTFRSAIALESVDGGALEDVEISNVEAKNTGSAIFIRLGHRNTDERVSTLRNVTISNVRVEVPKGQPDENYDYHIPPARLPPDVWMSSLSRTSDYYKVPGLPHNLLPSSITGLPGHPVQGVTLKNIAITFGGGGNRKNGQIPLDRLEKVPEQPSKYPEFTIFGELPAWGFYCRHAEGIKFENVTIGFKEKDYRAALVCDDVKGLELDGFKVLSTGEEPNIVLHEVHRALIQNSPPPADAKEFMRILEGCSEIDRR